MSARWFRFYADAMRHPKVAKLPDATFRLWVQLMCVAAENNGRIPSAADLKFMLNRRLDHLLKGLDDLIRASLIDPLGDGYEPHSWNERQYKSDTSTDRVRKHREKRNVSETPPETEAETDIEPSVLANSGSPDEHGCHDEVIPANPSGQGCGGEAVPAKPKIGAAHIDEAFGQWNKAAIDRGWPTLRVMTDARRKKLASRLKAHGPDGWREALVIAYRSQMLSASPPPTWFNFDWLVKNDENLLKVLEGNYSRAPSSGFEKRQQTQEYVAKTTHSPEAIAAARQRLAERGEFTA